MHWTYPLIVIIGTAILICFYLDARCPDWVNRVDEWVERWMR